jgi:hypothetical protein
MALTAMPDNQHPNSAGAGPEPPSRLAPAMPPLAQRSPQGRASS